MRNVICLSIKGYQRYVSPYKGFCCAHRHLHGGVGCSGYALRVFRKYPFLKAYSMTLKRFNKCKVAAATLSENERESGNSQECLNKGSNVALCCF